MDDLALQANEGGYNNLPSYLIAADSHNVGESGGTFSFADPSSWYETVSSAGKFITAAVVSGAAQLYNTGVATGNFFGADLEEMNTASAIASIDSDLGQYYVQNQAAVDIGGFVAGSFIPGLGSLKALQAAKAGTFGTNMARATNLLVPETENLILTAGKELANRQAAFRALDANVLRAFGTGIQAAAVESVIAEAAVAATMYKSPVLEDMTLSDLGANIFWGGLFGTAIGGALTSARIYSGVKRTVKAADTELNAVKLQTALPSDSLKSDGIIMSAFDQQRIATAEVSSDILTAETIAQERAASIENLKVSSRLRFQEMSANDSPLANTLADSLDGLPAQKQFESLFGAREVGRLGKKLKGEKDANEFAKQEALADVAGTPNMSAEPAIKVGYVPLFGRNAGAMTFDAPIPLRLADTVADGQKLESAIKNYGYKTISQLNTKSAVDADAQYLWAARNVKYREGMTVAADNIPALKELSKQLAMKTDPWKIVIADAKGVKREISNLSELVQHKIQVQERTARNLFGRRSKITVEEVASITDLSEEFLLPLKQKQNYAPSRTDYDYRAGINETYTKMLVSKNLSRGEEILDVSDRPMWAKVGYDTSKMNLPSQFEYDAMNLYATKWQMYSTTVRNSIASIAGEGFNIDRFVRVDDYDLGSVSRFDAAPGVFSATNAGYDSLGSKMQMLGIATRDFNNMQKGLTDAALNPSLQNLLADETVAYEVNVINKLVSQAPEPYVLNTELGGLVPLKLWKYERALAAGEKVSEPELSQGMKEFVPIKGRAALDAWDAIVKRNTVRYSQMNQLRAAQGLIDSKSIMEAPVVYPIRKNYRDFKHFVFVVDEKVTGTGHVSMIHAKDEQQLAGLISKVPKDFKVITKQESELWHKAMGDYDFERTLHDNYIDATLKRSGVDSDFVLETDPQQIVTKILEHNYRADRALSTEVVRASNEKAFATLEKLGERYEALSSSTLGSKGRVPNPYKDYIRTALNLSTLEEDSLLSTFNTQADAVFSKFSNALSTAMTRVRGEKDLDELNGLMEQYGVKGAYHDAAIAAYQDGAPDRGALSRFVQRANSLVSTFALGTDPFHAAANIIGNNVMLGSELNSLVKAVKSGNSEVAGRLSILSEIVIPGTGGKAMLSPQKMIARAYGEWFGAEKPAMVKLYSDMGFNPNYRKQIQQLNEDLIIQGTEGARVLDGKISKAMNTAGDFLSKPTTWSEEFNRFVTVNVAKQVTDLAEQAGVLSRNESLAVINTFLNRVQGNLIASQRPLVMQGPIGMAIGLFQTYQFNLLQQMFRMVGEGAPKDALYMLGLQGSIFGMNGMPAFNFINTHLVGTASGNQQHRDLYDATYGIAGKQAGDWLMYGVASNLPKLAGAPGTNIYTRGDINPRQMTILPSSLDEIPFVRAGAAVWNTFAGVAQQVGLGAPMGETLTQALEHNGLSRPLAGLAQVLQAAGGNGNVYATDNNGVVRGSNDLLSVTSLMRVAGARPMDESIANDFYFRLKVYQAQDRQKLENIRDAVRKSVIQGNTLEGDQYGKFLEEYLKAGGKAKGFNKWIMKQYTEANVPATQKLAAQLGTPYAQRMQEFLRGRTVTQEDLGAPPLEELSGSGSTAP